MSTAQHKILIIGSGVIGLTIAHVLSENPERYSITVVARDLPDDLDSQQWSSPWAGALIEHANSTSDERTKRWRETSFNKFWDLMPTGLVKIVPIAASTANRPPTYEENIVLSVNPLLYLPWMKSQLENRGVTFVRKRLRSIEDAAEVAGPNGVVVNATGLGARSLIGVEDTKVFPKRGQTILVQNSEVDDFYEDHELDANGVLTYVFPRSGPGNTVLLGGTSQDNNWDTSYHEATAQKILAKCGKHAPTLLDRTKTRILSHNVGLRPAREGGPRVEVEWVKLPLSGVLVPRAPATSQQGGIIVIHAYGFGSSGYEESWGAAYEAVDLVSSSIEKPDNSV